MIPSVSVVIPAFNAQDHIAECLASVFVQGNGPTCEVIVVNDGSTDDITSIMRDFPQVTLLEQGNRGPSAARNYGFRHAHGEYIAFLDADDLWPVGKLRMQIDMLVRHPDAAMCFGDCRQFEDSRQWPQTLFEEGGYGELAWGQGPYLAEAYARLLGDNFITTGSVVVRRRVLDALGGFDESLHLVEDLDLWLRIARRHPVLWIPELCLLRRRHADNLSRDADAMSLAYLDVLARHAAVDRNDPAAQDIDFTALMAREYLLLADRALNRGAATEAKRWARRCLALRPSLAALWRWMQGAAPSLRPRPAGN